MKKYIVLALLLLAGKYGSARTTNDIDKGVKDSFHVLFPHAQGESWLESPDTYLVYFINNGIQERVFYPKQGSFFKVLRYYEAADLLPDIQLLLKHRFPRKKVFLVTEVSTINRCEGGGEIKYEVAMDDEHRWYKVLVDGSEAPRVILRYRK